MSSLSATDRIGAQIRDDILTGRLRPGERLNEVELAARFGVSRNTLRDSVKQLVLSGLAILRPNAGCTVRELTEADARDIYRVRRTLEAAGVMASSGVPRERLELLQIAAAASRNFAADLRWRETGTESLRFHRILVGFLGSPRLDTFFDNILAQLRLVFAVMSDEANFQQQWIERDQELADLLTQGNRSFAAARLAQYLDESEALVVDTIRAEVA